RNRRSRRLPLRGHAIVSPDRGVRSVELQPEPDDRGEYAQADRQSAHGDPEPDPDAAQPGAASDQLADVAAQRHRSHLHPDPEPAPAGRQD
ncbi:hypothetical protein ABTK26_20265, partial [Acinetobacter baumannii]